MAMIGLSSPWVLYYRNVAALFEKDPSIHVILDNDTTTLKLYADTTEKFEALKKVFPEYKEFGNVKLTIEIVPANTIVTNKHLKNDATEVEIFKTLFDGNRAVAYIKEVSGVFPTTFTYIVFIKQVVQFFTDNLTDLNGISSTLYQNVAREIFPDTDYIFFCTDTATDSQCSCKFSF